MPPSSGPAEVIMSNSPILLIQIAEVCVALFVSTKMATASKLATLPVEAVLRVG